MTSSHERLFVGQHSSLRLKPLYAHSLGLHHYYLINSLLYLRIIQDMYIVLYRELISQLCTYTHLLLEFWQKDIYQMLTVPPSKLKEILSEVRKTLRVTNPDYDIVIDILHLYYDMQSGHFWH